MVNFPTPTSPASYLQVLSPDQAALLVEVLPKVKAHFVEELEWLQGQLESVQGQVSDKTTQIKVIEAMLVETEAIAQTTKDNTQSPQVDLIEVASDSSVVVQGLVGLVASIAAEGTTSDEVKTKTEPTNPAPAPAPSPSSGSKARAKSSLVKSKQAAKPESKPKSGAAKKGKGQGTELSQYVRQEFQGQPMRESIVRILEQAIEPVTIDGFLGRIYDGLDSDATDRARHSLATTLSAGKRNGQWQTVERGLYVR